MDFSKIGRSLNSIFTVMPKNAKFSAPSGSNGEFPAFFKAPPTLSCRSIFYAFISYLAVLIIALMHYNFNNYNKPERRYNVNNHH